MRVEQMDDPFEKWDEQAHARKLAATEFGGCTQDPNLLNFIRSQQRQMEIKRHAPPEPDAPLPRNCQWQLDGNNQWSLVMQRGRSGFVRYSGTVEELVEFSRHLEVN